MRKCSANISLRIKLKNIVKKRFIHTLDIKRTEITLKLVKCYFSSAGKPTYKTYTLVI